MVRLIRPERSAHSVWSRFKLRVKSVRASILLMSCVILCNGEAKATELELTLTSGSVLTAPVPLETLTWNEVQTNGKLKHQRIRVADIRRLDFCATPASSQIADVRRHLEDLGSDDYLIREAAEAELATPDVGGRFPGILRSFAATADAEASYRLKRVEGVLRTAQTRSVSEFDRLTLRSGRTLLGDAGDFEFSVNIDGQSLTLERSELRMIRANQPRARREQAGGPIVTEVVHDPAGKFYLAEQTTIDFEEDAAGNELTRTQSVEETYASEGLQLNSVERGYIGISGYGFKFPNTPTGKNSASVFLEIRRGTTTRYQRFRGTLQVNFCLPNQPAARAGVHEFGIHIANVDNTRDFILEAIDANGNILATVEAGTRDCPFLGVRSNELIAGLRLRTNPFLGRLQRKIDADYAFDAICFSTPKRLPADRSVLAGDAAEQNAAASITLNNGDVWVGQKVELGRDGTLDLVTDAFDREPRFDAALVRSYTFANRITQRKPNRRSWTVLLAGGSQLQVTPGGEFKSQLIPGYSVPQRQIVALWPTGPGARFPAEGDFDESTNVIVLPTGRLLTDGVRFDKTGYAWTTAQRRVQRLSEQANEAAQTEDAMPEDFNRVTYKTADASEAPTLWLQRPASVSARPGFVQLTDGQRLVFGQGQRFQLTGRSAEATTLSLRGKTVSIPTDRIESFKFETSDE